MGVIMIELLQKLEKFLQIKSPYGVFFWFEDQADINEPVASFENDLVCMEFRRTDTEENLDVRFFNPYDPDNFVAYTWDVIKGDFNSYIEEGTPVANAAAMMESIRYVGSNVLDLINRP